MMDFLIIGGNLNSQAQREGHVKTQGERDGQLQPRREIAEETNPADTDTLILDFHPPEL